MRIIVFLNVCSFLYVLHKLPVTQPKAVNIFNRFFAALPAINPSISQKAPQENQYTPISYDNNNGNKIKDEFLSSFSDKTDHDTNFGEEKNYNVNDLIKPVSDGNIINKNNDLINKGNDVGNIIRNDKNNEEPTKFSVDTEKNLNLKKEKIDNDKRLFRQSIKKENDEKIINLLRSLIPPQPSKIKDTPSNNFKKELEEPLEDYLIMAFHSINLMLMNNINYTEKHIVDFFVFNDAEFGLLLQHYYDESENIIKSFKIYWFFSDIEYIWNLYAKSEEKTKYTFFKFFTDEMCSEMTNTTFHDDTRDKNKPFKGLKALKDYFKQLIKSKSKIMKNKCNWLTIKNLSMRSFINSQNFEKLHSINFEYRTRESKPEKLYDMIVSEKDIYALFKFYYVSVAKLFHEINEWYININLTYSRIYYFGYNENTDFTDVEKFITNNINLFVTFFKNNFPINVFNLCSENTKNMIEFMNSPLKDLDIAIYANKDSFRESNKIYGADIFSNSFSKFKEKDEEGNELSKMYWYFAKKASGKLDKIHHKWNLKKPLENNYYEEFVDETYFNEVMDLMNIISKSLEPKKYTELKNNLLHINLSISVYICRLSQGLKIDSAYEIFETDDVYDENDDATPDTIHPGSPGIQEIKNDSEHEGNTLKKKFNSNKCSKSYCVTLMLVNNKNMLKNI